VSATATIARVSATDIRSMFEPTADQLAAAMANEESLPAALLYADPDAEVFELLPERYPTPAHAYAARNKIRMMPGYWHFIVDPAAVDLEAWRTEWEAAVERSRTRRAREVQP
jgi:hypothetical protein